MSSTQPTTDSVRQPALVIQFARWPEAGKVKTRLASVLGDQGALSAHVALCMAVLRQISASGLPLELWWDRALETPPPAALPILTALERRNVRSGVQNGADLGTRMEQALKDGLTRYERVLLVGSDCPSVDAQYLRRAVSALDQSDVVIGPAEDGGFVLIGARRVMPGMLAGIAWGKDSVRAETLAQFTRYGLSVSQLESRWDVDSPEDWERYLALPKA
ncbi:MAG: TIGR04282 family arsenosugar biosynthesis glycosyltransferase [Gammaproteobacteria bacterium]|nr:TIGR04282 family arsenosugar biosynthesis glycosyltransferase [Gammaproteobacteria bacterium]